MEKKETAAEIEARKKAYEELNNLNYGSYLQSNRQLWGISRQKLSEGLCTRSLVSEMEAGKKSACRLLRERLLRHSGVASEEYEKYLNYEDSNEWRLREAILDALEAKDTKEMQKLLVKYANQYGFAKNAFGKQENIAKRLQRQFYLGMLGMCRRLEGAGAEELVEIFDTAVQQSVPGIHEKRLVRLVLCAEEINLILEYARCLPEEEAIWQCRQLEQYLRDARMEEDAKALNYPKVIFVLGQLLLKQKSVQMKDCKEVIQLYNRGIELLRKTNKAYYIWELLGIQKAAVERIRELLGEKEDWVQYEWKEIEEIEKMEDWAVPFGHLYEKFGIKKEQGSDAYLYRGQDIYDIGDVIRIRRIMLGITQGEFQEKLTCTLETLQNLEEKKHCTHPFNLREMCTQLNLSPVWERTELAAASMEARKLEREIRYTANSRDFGKNLDQIEQLKKLIDMSHPINKQWVLRTEGMAKFQEKLIRDEEYEKIIQQSFMCTLPISVMEYPDEKECYLTNSETKVIYHYALLVGDEKPEEAYRRMKVVFRLEREFEKEGREMNHIRTYELYMMYKAKLLSFMGRHEEAQQYAEKTIRMCLQMGRINFIASILYRWIWDKEKQTKKAEPADQKYDLKLDLQCCLGLSQFCQNSKQQDFFKGIIDAIMKET